MSTVQEIKAAIQRLTNNERAELAADLPSILPEMDGDAAWECIIRDPRPRPDLTALLDQVEAEYLRDPASFKEISEEQFQQNQ